MPFRLSESSAAALPRVYGVDYARHVYASVSEYLYKQYIIKLTENGSRSTQAGPPPTFSDVNLHARHWIMSMLEELSNGRIEVELMGTHCSIVGRLPGWIGSSAPCIVIGGHYDSVPQSPGANDDGSGVATVLELARVLSAYVWPLDIYFCAWNSEELGLLGSSEVAHMFAQQGLDILVYYNVDMLLVEDPGRPPDERVFMVFNDYAPATYHDSAYWADLTRMMSRNLGRDLILPVRASEFPYWWQSDHASFVHNDYESVLFAFESGDALDTAYHTSNDRWDNELYNYTLADETVACIGASIAFTMAREYGAPSRLEYSVYLQSGAFRGYYVVATIDSPLNISVMWSGGPVELTVFSPMRESIAHVTLSNESGIVENVLTPIMNLTGLYTVHVRDLDPGIVSVKLSMSYESDIEGDGVPDSEQYWFDTALFEYDHDADGLSDARELIIGTSPWSPDTDGDGMSDLAERTLHQLSPDDYPFNPNVFNESPLALYAEADDEDGFVFPGQTLAYTATVQNNLSTDLYALGTLSLIHI